MSPLPEGNLQIDITSKDRQAIPVGDELVVTTSMPMMTLDGHSFEVDAVVVWRVVDNRIAEAWDIPAVHTRRFVTQA